MTAYRLPSGFDGALAHVYPGWGESPVVSRVKVEYGLTAHQMAEVVAR